MISAAPKNWVSNFIMAEEASKSSTKELKTYRKQEAKYLNSQIHTETENYQ